MGIFSWKKKDGDTTTIFDVVVPPHEHTWKDLPWYMEVGYDGPAKWAEYRIIEPYICVTCGEVKRKVLEQESWTRINAKDREEFYDKIRETYKDYLKPRAVVEDMILNIQLVKDPAHLAMVEKLNGTPHQGCGTSSKMDWSKNSEYKIKLGDKNENEVDKRKVGSNK